jgi:M6 family metalloprotease-like protein
MKLLKLCVAAIILPGVLLLQLATAAPFAKNVKYTQPDGSEIQLWGEGDDFYAIFETLDGYTVMFDAATRAYVYAAVSNDGSELVSTGVQVGQLRPAVLLPHLRINREVARATALERRNAWEEQTGIKKRWEALKESRRSFEEAVSLGPVPLSNFGPTLGQITGLVLLIDFDDAVGSIERDEIVDYCNLEGYAGYNNNGSVRDYYHDVSNGQLLYTNVVTAYVRIPNSLHPKSYYTDPTRDAGISANELIDDAVKILKAQPGYATEVAPVIDNITLDVSGRALALNVFYAGGNGGVWSQGLWPHKWGLYSVGAINLTARTTVHTYQITNMGDGLAIGTFFHENGHMICGFPDLYDYDYDSTGGAGKFCIMGSGGHGTNPSQTCAYLKYCSGWTTTVEVEPLTYLEASVSSPMDNPDYNKIYRVAKAVDGGDAPTEYYLFEGRNKAASDAAIPAEGLFIWHIDELGDRDKQSYEYNTVHDNYECSLVQADGLHHFENYVNSGDPNDSWYDGNTAPTYQNQFTDETTPSAKWWDGSESMMYITQISAVSETMTFLFAVPAPVMLTVAGALPAGREWATYYHAIGVSGGVPPLTWSIVNGALPDGLIFSATGVISGMPTLATNAEFDVVVSTTYGVNTTNSFSLLIRPVHTIPFTENFDSSGANLPESWRHAYVTNSIAWSIEQSRDEVYPAASYSPPNMICLYSHSYTDSVSRLLTPRIDFGDTAQAGRLSFQHYMRARDDSQDELRVYYKTEMNGEWSLLKTYNNDIFNWTERIIDLPVISRSVYIAFEGTARYGRGVCVDSVKVWDPTPPFGFVTVDPLPNAIIDEYYELALQVEGGYGSNVYSIVSNSLPAGMFLSPTGLVSGTASTVQRVYPRIQVVDNHGQIIEKTYSLMVTEPVVNLFEEGFERGGLMPYGWTQEYIDYSTSWTMYGGGSKYHPNAAHGGNYNAFLYAFDRDPDTGIHRTHTTRLISSKIDLGQAPQNIRLYFWHCMVGVDGNQDEVTVCYKNTGDGDWIDLETFSVNTPVWTQRSVSLPDPSSTYYIAFKGSARYGYGVCIDDIRITDESTAPIITTERDLPDGLVGFDYEVQMAASGGVQPYAWDIASGTLPGGLALSSDGILSGQPLGAFNGVFFVKVTGLDGFASTNRFALKIREAGTLPFIEDFESDGVMPEGWTQEIVNRNVEWQLSAGSPSSSVDRQPTAAYAGNWNAVLHSTVSGDPSITKLISPMLDMGGGVTNATLTFRHCMKEERGDQDKLYVWYRTSLTADWQILQTFAISTPEWVERTIDLPNPTSTYFIAFEGRASYGFGVCIDDVFVNGSVNSPYNSWLDENFTEQEVVDGLITGYYDDPDGDGILNIWEYAFDLNSTNYDASGTPTGGVFTNYLHLSYRQNMVATDLDFVVEACTDLILGDWSTNDISELLRIDSGGYWSVTEQHDVPVSDVPTRFMRLKLIIN